MSYKDNAPFKPGLDGVTKYIQTRIYGMYEKWVGRMKERSGGAVGCLWSQPYWQSGEGVGSEEGVVIKKIRWERERKGQETKKEKELENDKEVDTEGGILISRRNGW